MAVLNARPVQTTVGETNLLVGCQKRSLLDIGSEDVPPIVES